MHDIYTRLNRPDKVLLLEAAFDEHSEELISISTNYYHEIVYNLEHTVHHMALIRAAVLLNGAFEKHLYHSGYTKSRGLVLLDAISEARPVRYLVKTNLKTVEPFTLIVWDDNSLYEFRWDGAGKHCVQLRKSRHYIWSSATLYSKETMKKREYWLAKFLNKTPLPAVEDIMHFHASAGDGDGENDLKMTRQGLYATVSITSLTLGDVSSSILYLDCKNGTHHQQKINFISSSCSVAQSLLHENT